MPYNFMFDRIDEFAPIKKIEIRSKSACWNIISTSDGFHYIIRPSCCRITRVYVDSISRTESFRQVSFALNLDGTWKGKARVMHRPRHFCNGSRKRVLGPAKFGKPPGSRSNLLRVPSPDGQWPPSTWKSCVNESTVRQIRQQPHFVAPIILIFDNQLC